MQCAGSVQGLLDLLLTEYPSLGFSLLFILSAILYILNLFFIPAIFYGAYYLIVGNIVFAVFSILKMCKFYNKVAFSSLQKENVLHPYRVTRKTPCELPVAIL